MPMNQADRSRSRIAVRFLRNVIAPHRTWYVTASLLALLSVGTGLLQARATQDLIDRVKDGTVFDLVKYAGFFIGLIAVNALMGYIGKRCVSKLGAKAGFDLKLKIADALLHAEYREIGRLEAGNALQTVNMDTQVVCDFIGGDLIQLFSQFAMALGALAYVVCVNPLLALVTFLYTPLGMYFTMSLNRRMNGLYRIKADREGGALSAAEQALSCIPVIKSFLAEKRMREKLALSYDSVYRTGLQIKKWDALMQTACSSTSAIPRITYMVFAGILTMNGQLSVGVLISVFGLLTYIIGPTVYMPFLLNGLNRSVASIERIERLLQLPRERERAEHPQGPFISLRQVDFSHEQGKKIISNLTFSHTGPGIVALCGKSGSGKTTLLDLIAGAYPPDRGAIEVGGGVAEMPQDADLFEGSIMDNVRIAKPDATEEQVRRAMAEAGADRIEEAEELSGGEKQRISLARTILSGASVWLLDEPTSALDAETEQIILNTLRAYAGRKLILIAAHRPRLIQLAERRLDL